MVRQKTRKAEAWIEPHATERYNAGDGRGSGWFELWWRALCIGKWSVHVNLSEYNMPDIALP